MLAIGQWAGIVIALLGLFFVGWEVRHLGRQQKVATDATTSQLYGQVSEAMYRLNRLFGEKPDWWQYFYKNVKVPKALHDQIENVCELMLDFIDAVVEQKRALPPEVSMDWSTWEAYFRFVYNSSPALRAFVRGNLDFYPDYFFAALGYVVVRQPSSGEVISEWEIREAEEGTPLPLATNRQANGYPWIRTWIIKRVRRTRVVAQPTKVEATVKGIALDPPWPRWRSHFRSQGSDRAKVTFRWEPEPVTTENLDCELHVLQRWIVGTMEGTGVKSVEFDLPGRRPTYLTTRPKARAGTSSFLIPEYRPALLRSARANLKRLNSSLRSSAKPRDIEAKPF